MTRFGGDSEGHLIAQKVAGCSPTPRLASRARASSLCWSMSLGHFLCLQESCIFYKFRIRELVLYSGQVTCQLILPWKEWFFVTFFATSVPSLKKPSWIYTIKQSCVPCVLYWIMKASACTDESVGAGLCQADREIKIALSSAIDCLYVNHCSFHLKLAAAGY